MINFPEPVTKKKTWLELPNRVWGEIELLVAEKGITQEQALSALLLAGFDLYEKSIPERVVEKPIVAAVSPGVVHSSEESQVESPILPSERVVVKRNRKASDPGEVIKQIDEELSGYRGRKLSIEEHKKSLALYAKKYYYQRRLKKSIPEVAEKIVSRRTFANGYPQPNELPPTEFDYCANPKCPKQFGKHVKGSGVSRGDRIFCNLNCSN